MLFLTIQLDDDDNDESVTVKNVYAFQSHMRIVLIFVHIEIVNIMWELLLRLALQCLCCRRHSTYLLSWHV